MTIPDETLIRLLPASCRLLLQDGIPLPAVVALIARYGGAVLYVPNTIDESSDLAQAIGLESARKLAAKCRGGMYYVPRAYRLERHRRDIAILQAYADGQPLPVIARSHHISDRTVSAIVARHSKPNRRDRRQNAGKT